MKDILDDLIKQVQEMQEQQKRQSRKGKKKKILSGDAPEGSYVGKTVLRARSVETDNTYEGVELEISSISPYQALKLPGAISEAMFKEVSEHFASIDEEFNLKAFRNTLFFNHLEIMRTMLAYNDGELLSTILNKMTIDQKHLIVKLLLEVEKSSRRD